MANFNSVSTSLLGIATIGVLIVAFAIMQYFHTAFAWPRNGMTLPPSFIQF
ncbi:hypothetical protein G6M86_26545 (plasmid) [Agrobacterium tumefaciens]|uniref:Uncharacterized protein n=1 Tax=Agrobacterium tumefaciens TaxID=358 RepID=A0AAJ4TDA7_AGRTU|nr:hypothetical protein G6M86_26545 [Agrobacterium tumefaciens]